MVFCLFADLSIAARSEYKSTCVPKSQSSITTGNTTGNKGELFTYDKKITSKLSLMIFHQKTDFHTA